MEGKGKDREVEGGGERDTGSVAGGLPATSGGSDRRDGVLGELVVLSASAL